MPRLHAGVKNHIFLWGKWWLRAQRRCRCGGSRCRRCKRGHKFYSHWPPARVEPSSRASAPRTLGCLVLWSRCYVSRAWRSATTLGHEQGRLRQPVQRVRNPGRPKHPDRTVRFSCLKLLCYRLGRARKLIFSHSQNARIKDQSGWHTRVCINAPLEDDLSLVHDDLIFQLLRRCRPVTDRLNE